MLNASRPLIPSVPARRMTSNTRAVIGKSRTPSLSSGIRWPQCGQLDSRVFFSYVERLTVVSTTANPLEPPISQSAAHSVCQFLVYVASRVVLQDRADQRLCQFRFGERRTRRHVRALQHRAKQERVQTRQLKFHSNRLHPLIFNLTIRNPQANSEFHSRGFS